ncbi:hypothetical protein NADFUDRAFT_31053 [Nadsonia fulvescens var. elongata DSM 6958]|uniref:PNPLA domain-containing protein n=1 Tax=Nadsonia fulvescens var. elongata DSM 6958 TaxID=857566 RepID=A0A1E3PT29_9ASCO|nr:hypothetical protein NADFUDRAFT_31053 [Nadsonia fulvescens var. elongata DSM 6958]
MWIITLVLKRIISIIMSLLDVLFDVMIFWSRRIYTSLSSKTKSSKLKYKLAHANNYEEWEKYALKLDRLLANDIWRQRASSGDYDYRLISNRLNFLLEAKDHGDALTISNGLRSGLLRNLGSMANKRLYTRSYLGTKHLIEDYVSEVINCLKYLQQYNVPTSSLKNLSINLTETSSSHMKMKNYIATQQKFLNFFHDTRQSFGRTALVLQGGSIFGLCHLGVIKTLFFKGLLPRIFTCINKGAIIGSLICAFPDEDLIPLLDHLSENVAGFSNRLSEKLGEESWNNNNSTNTPTISTILKYIIEEKNPPEVVAFELYVKSTLMDLTFEEAYNRSDRVLNIVVHSEEKAFSSSSYSLSSSSPFSSSSSVLVLNYLTAPNTVIWSAIMASKSKSRGIKELQIKDADGNVTPYQIEDEEDEDELNGDDLDNQGKKSSSDKYNTTSFTSTISNDPSVPYTRITELFNVNHYIVSISRPYLAPLLAIDTRHRGYHGWRATAVRLINLEFQHRLRQLDYFKLLPHTFKRFFLDDNMPSGSSGFGSARGGGDYLSGGTTLNNEVIIVPEFPMGLVNDFKNVFREGDLKDKIDYWTLIGERSTWPMLSIIWARCAIEFMLDDIYSQARRRRSGFY